MNIPEKEQKETVVYQETLKIDVKNINKNIKKIWRPIYEVIDDPFLEETDISTRLFILSKNNPNQPQFLPSYVKTV